MATRQAGGRLPQVAAFRYCHVCYAHSCSPGQPAVADASRWALAATVAATPMVRQTAMNLFTAHVTMPLCATMPLCLTLDATSPMPI